MLLITTFIATYHMNKDSLLLQSLKPVPIGSEQRLRRIKNACEEAFRNVAGSSIECNVFFFDQNDPGGTTGFNFMCSHTGAAFNINMLMDWMGSPDPIKEKVRELMNDNMVLLGMLKMKDAAAQQGIEFPKENQGIIDEIQKKYGIGQAAPEPVILDIDGSGPQQAG